MALTRRQFLTLTGGTAATAVVFQACGVPANEVLAQSPVRMPEDLVSGLDNWYATVSDQSPGGDGIVVRVMEGRAHKVEGNVDYPINRGKHNALSEAALQSVYHPDRIKGPMVRTGNRGSGQFDEISWTDALSRVADQLSAVRNKAGIVTVTRPANGHVEVVTDRFVSKLGGRRLSYEPLENTTLRAAVNRVFGQTTLPDFDIENTDYLLSFGADFLSTWLSPVRFSRGYGEFRQGDRERGTMVHVDSRFSMTAANADEWVFVNPGWEGMLAMSMINVIVNDGPGDSGATAALTGNGAVDLGAYAPETIGPQAGVDADKIRRIAHEFAEHSPSLAVGGGSAAAHTNGLFNLQAIYSLNHLAGSVNSAGGVVFNPEPAFGPTVASDSFTSIQQLVTDMNGGGVQALLVRGADPVYGMPEAAGFQEALRNVPLIVSFSGHMDDTTAMADVVLPEHNALEDWGTQVPEPGPGYQMVGFQQAVIRPFFENRGVHLGTKSFPEVLMALAQVLDVDLELDGETFKDVIRADMRKIYDDGRGSVGMTPTTQYTTFEAFWNACLQHGFWSDESARFVGQAPAPQQLPATPQNPSFGRPEGSSGFALAPFASSSLTDGRGAHLPWLQAMPDPLTTAVWRTWVEINSAKAEEMDIKEGDVIRVTSTDGRSIEAIAYPHPGVSPDVVSIPFGQGHDAGGRYAEGRGSNVFSMLTPLADTETGALAWSATRVNIEKTDEWFRLPRFENTAPDLATDPDQHIIELTPNG